MDAHQGVANHYTHGDLLNALFGALQEAGKDPDHLSAEDLFPFDQLHGRGLEATQDLFEFLDPEPDDHLLDMGSGIGGPARYAALAFGCRVTGIDLTDEFCAVATALSRRVNLDNRTSFRQGDATALPFADATFDGAYTHNVAMSVPDRRAFHSEAFRVLKPGSEYVAAEPAQGPGGPAIFPAPWARTPELSHLITPEETRGMLEEIGFLIEAELDETDASIAFQEKMKARMEAEGLPILGPHLVLRDNAWERLKNAGRNVAERRTLPVVFVCRKP